MPEITRVYVTQAQADQVRREILETMFTPADALSLDFREWLRTFRSREYYIVPDDDPRAGTSRVV